MNFSLKDRKSQYQLLFLLIILVSAFFYFGSFQPRTSQLVVAQQAYEQVSQEIVYGRKRAQELRDYSQEVIQLQTRVQEVEGRLLGGNRILLFLQALQDRANTAGTQVIQLEPEQARDQGEIFEQPVHVLVKGSLPRVRQFLTLVEELPYPAVIHEASLELPQGGTGTEISGDFTIIMYSLKGGEV